GGGDGDPADLLRDRGDRRPRAPRRGDGARTAGGGADGRRGVRGRDPARRLRERDRRDGAAGDGGGGVVNVGWVRDYGVVVVLAALVVVFSLSTGAFLTTTNLQNLAQQTGEPGLIACGMTAVIIAGEFDLSVGAIFGF